MADAIIKLRGALVALLEKKDDPIHVLCVKMPTVPHETRFWHKPARGAETHSRIGGPLRFVASPAPSKGKHTKTGIVSAAAIGLGIPLYQKAATVILLPPGEVTGGAPYPCKWKIGTGPTQDICGEIVVKLPGVTSLEAHYGSTTIDLDLGYEHALTHLPVGHKEKPGDVPTFDHFDHYAHVGGHGDPKKIKIPKKVGVCLASASSVCPPVGYP